MRFPRYSNSPYFMIQPARDRAATQRTSATQEDGDSIDSTPPVYDTPCYGVPRLLALIHGMAEYEHLTHQVTATEEALLASLFGDPPAAEALLAFADGEPEGFAVYFHTYSTFLARRSMYLEDLYVSPEYRRRGLGTLLLRRVAVIAVARGCGRFEWLALDWNTDAHRFYEDSGAEMLPEWRVFRIHGDALSQLAEDEDRSMH